MTERWLTTGEMTRATGLSPKALRLYHEKGLLVPAEVNDATGYRVYTSDQVERGHMIGQLRRLDLPLDLIRDVVDSSALVAGELLLTWWGEHRRTAAELREAWVMRAAPGAAGQRDVRRRSVGARKLATLVGETAVPMRLTTLTGDAQTIRAHLAAQGATFDDEYWVVFHSLPGLGPGATQQIETCVPYEGTIDPGGDVGLRLVPAGEEVYVPLTVGEITYPEVLDAHVAVAAAARAAGNPLATRHERFVAPWDADDPDAVVGEVVARW